MRSGSNAHHDNNACSLGLETMGIGTWSVATSGPPRLKPL